MGVCVHEPCAGGGHRKHAPNFDAAVHRDITIGRHTIRRNETDREPERCHRFDAAKIRETRPSDFACSAVPDPECIFDKQREDS